jgi:hypothetical protein
MLDTIMATTVGEGTLPRRMGIKILPASAARVVVHGGRTLAPYDIVVTDAGGHRVGTSRLTGLIRDHASGLDLNGAG